MPDVLVQESSLQAIAEAIRYKTGGNDTCKPREMAPAIRNLPGTGVLQNLSVTENGNYTPGAGVDGYDFVSVAVTGGFGAGDEGKVVINGALMPQTSLAVSENGTYNTTDKNSVVVNVSGGAANVIYSTEEPSGSGSQGSFWVYYDNTASIEVSVTGGYNGGAVIVVTVNGDEVYRAAGSSPYNTSYTVVNSAPSFRSENSCTGDDSVRYHRVRSVWIAGKCSLCACQQSRAALHRGAFYRLDGISGECVCSVTGTKQISAWPTGCCSKCRWF